MRFCLVLLIICAIIVVATFWYFDSVRNLVHRVLHGKNSSLVEISKIYNRDDANALKKEKSPEDAFNVEKANGDGVTNDKSVEDGLKHKKSNSDSLRNTQHIENMLLLQLAQLYILSPEHILRLVTNKDLEGTCRVVSEALLDINNTISEDTTLPPENLYMRLYKGLEFFKDAICQETRNFWNTYLNNGHECIEQLRINLIECEGPPDWFESTNQAEMCQNYNDIATCQFSKAAVLCGLKVAELLRNLSIAIMRAIVPIKCKVSRSLPDADTAIPPTSDAPVRRSNPFWDV